VHHKHTTLGPLECLTTWDDDDDDDEEEPSINFYFLIHNTGKEYYLQIKLKLGLTEIKVLVSLMNVHTAPTLQCQFNE
jgi:hypothetical protein